MSTLTEAAAFSKRASVWAVIAIAVIIFLMIFLGIWSSIKKALFPSGPPPSSVAFGKLPRFDISDGFSAPSGITYQLETVSGSLPELPTSAKVFAIYSAMPSFSSLDQLKQKAKLVQFTSEPVETGSGQVKFTDPQEEARTLTFVKLTGNFTLSSNYSADQTIITSRPGSLEGAIKTARAFFENFDVSDLQFPKDRIETKFQRIDGGTLTQTQSLASANLVEVDFARSDIDKLPVIWPKEIKPLVSVLVSRQGIAAANLDILPIKKNSFASYPLKGVAKAFEELKAGNAGFNKPLTEREVIISDVSLGYVESAKNDMYLEPVYLFRSPNGLIGYVGAVSDLWTK